MIGLVVNGKDDSTDEGTTVSSLLDKHGLDGGQVVVEYNGEALPRARYAVTVLHDGDRIEVVRAVAGGAL